jgi:hypothetical protein
VARQRNQHKNKNDPADNIVKMNDTVVHKR